MEEKNTAHLTQFVYPVYQKIKEKGHQVYLVGGCVRDIFLKRPISDWDLTTSASPEKIQEIFPQSFYENEFGTVGIPLPDANGIVEITTFRKDLEYKDFRHPTSVEWGKTLDEDLMRRDFTINAIAAEIKSVEPTVEFNIIDPFNGQEDILKKEIRAVGKADQRFNEDALRLMRAVRFATQLNFSIESSTWEAILENAKLLEHVSRERIRDELFKILASDAAFEGILLLDKSGMLGIVLPQLMKGKGISQERPGRHHKSDVFTHNLMSLKETPSTDPLVKLAALIHDIGKPYVQAFDENGLVIFHNHEVVGAKIANEIADSLRLSKKQKEKLYTLVRWHMFTVSEHLTDSAIRRFIRRIGVENVKDMMDLRIGDRLGGGTQNAESWRLKKFKERLEEQLHPPFSIHDMAVDGSDVMRVLKLEPGPQVGEILQTLFEEVDEDLSKNDREYLLKRIKEIEKTSNSV